jgi:hypothetical protein
MVEQRKHPRYMCAGGVELSVPGTNRRTWGHLSDVSQNGFYMETAEPWEIGIEVVARLDACENEIHASARVVTSHPGVGMGLILTNVYPQSQANFDRLLSRLASAAEEPASAAAEHH